MTDSPSSSAQPGFIPYVGIKTEGRESGRSVCTLEIDDRHRNPNGFVHGGVPYVLADTGMAVATFSVLDEGQAAVTVEISMVYVAPAKEGVLRCETTVINKGGRLVTLESAITCGDLLIAKALGTYTVIQRR